MSNKNLTRIPKAISYDYKAIERNFPINGRLIMDIMVFLSNSQMKDVFGNVNFSLDDFCNKMGYKKSNLQRKLTQEEREFIVGKGIDIPVYRRNGETFEHLIENVFESALWKAMKENLLIYIDTKDKSSWIGIQLLSRFDIYYNTDTKKTTKRTYSALIGSQFQDLLLTNYNLLELSDYVNIPNNEGYRTFYVFLCRILTLIKFRIENKQPPYYIVSIDQLAAIFNSKHTRNDNKKQYVTKTLDSINNILEKTKFSYKYITNGGKYKYFVQFEFSEETLAYFDEKAKAVFFKSLLGASEKLFIDTYTGFSHLKISERYAHFRELMKETDPDWSGSSRKIFWDWFQSDECQDQKRVLYRKVYFEIFNAYPEDLNNFAPI